MEGRAYSTLANSRSSPRYLRRHLGDKSCAADNAKSGSTVGGDKNYDTADFVAGCRERGCTPHVSQNDTNRRSAIDARTTRHPGYRISTIKRKRIEEPFGWMKTVGGLRKTRYRGRGLVGWVLLLTEPSSMTKGCSGTTAATAASARSTSAI